MPLGTEVPLAGVEGEDPNHAGSAGVLRGRRHGTGPWQNTGLIIGLVAVAFACLLGSFLVRGKTTEILRTSNIGPVSTTGGQTQVLLLPRPHAQNSSYHLDLEFHFHADVLKTGETVFDIGSPMNRLAASVSEAVDGYRYVVLYAPRFSAVLVNHLMAGHTYTVTIEIEPGSAISASVDDQQQFDYSRLPSDSIPFPKSVTVGGPAPALPAQFGASRGTSSAASTGSVPTASPLIGSVAGFTVFSREVLQTGSDLTILVLRIAAGVLAVLSILFVLLRMGRRRSIGRRSRSIESQDSEMPSWAREYAAPLGILLLVAGVTTLVIVTPLDNAVLVQSGTQRIAAGAVGPNQKTTYALFGEPALFAGAASLDVHLAFQMRLDRPLAPRAATDPVVSTFKDDQGLEFTMQHLPKGPYLTGAVGSNGWLPPGTTYNLLFNVPLHRWVSISVNVERSQSFIYRVNGQQVQSLTLNLPVLRPAPSMLAVSGGFGGSVRSATMVVTLFATQMSRASYLLIRLAQVMGIVLIVAAVILLAQRYLSDLIPTALRARRSLVLTTFWSMGVSLAINVLVDLPRFQRASGLLLERNTWLNSQYSRFGDFFVPFELLHSLNPYNIQNGSYPPIGYWLLAPVVWLNEYAALFVTLALVLGFLVWWLWRSFTCGMPVHQRILIVVVALLSLPITFGDRGNIDLIIFVIVVVGIAAFEQQKNLKAALWLGLAGAAKITPILYLLLFLRGRKLKYLVIGVAFAGFLTALGFSGFRSGLIGSLGDFKAGLSSLQVQNHNAKGSTPFNASILGWLQSLGYAAKGLSGAQAVNNALERFVVPVEILGVLVLAWYIRWRESSLWRSVTLITGLFILLNQVSYYYELIFLFVPLSLFVKHATVNRRGIVIGVLFGIVLAPRAYFYLANSRVDSSVLTTAPLLIALLVAVVYDGYRERRGLDGSAESADESREAEPSLPTSA